MSGILEQIVERNRPALEERKLAVPFRELEAAAADVPARPGFAAAFRGPGVHVIAELKKASPSKGVIREFLDVPELAKRLEEAGAAALSVLTEPFYFQGSLDNLRNAAGTVPSISARSTRDSVTWAREEAFVLVSMKSSMIFLPRVTVSMLVCWLSWLSQLV